MATAQEVTSLYRELLGRDPDPGGLKHYMGQSSAAARASISSSPERQSYMGRQSQNQEAAWNQQLSDFSNRYRADTEALLNRQKQEQEGLFGQYEQAIAGQEKLPDIYKRLQQEQGIPTLQQEVGKYKGQIYGVQNLLDRLDEDITSRTAGTLTSEAQRRRMVGAEGEDLRNQLGRLGTGLQPLVEQLTGAQQEVGTLLSLTSDQQKKDLSPMELRINSLSDRFAREITGFTQSREQELTSILDSINRGRELADREWQLAQQLAAEEREFSRQKSMASQAITSLGGGGRTSSASIGPGMQRKQDGGFAFTNAQGQSISAAAYSQQTGVPIGQLLYQMGAQGDTYAANAYRWLNYVQGSSMANNQQQLLAKSKQNFPALFWGV